MLIDWHVNISGPSRFCGPASQPLTGEGILTAIRRQWFITKMIVPSFGTTPVLSPRPTSFCSPGCGSSPGFL